jgi:hypothetical protein
MKSRDPAIDVYTGMLSEAHQQILEYVRFELHLRLPDLMEKYEEGKVIFFFENELILWLEIRDEYVYLGATKDLLVENSHGHGKELGERKGFLFRNLSDINQQVLNAIVLDISQSIPLRT